MSVTEPVELDAQDMEWLSWVAVGRSALVPEAALQRLLEAGLVRVPERRIEGTPPLELTAQGLARVRSSDQ